MATARERRFAAQIPWVTFQNISGQKIPAFSVVLERGWVTPDLSDGNKSQSPYFRGDQFDSEQKYDPVHLYITDAMAVLPGGWGRAARPDTYPQLVQLDTSLGGVSQLYQISGPVPDSWKLSADGGTGFIISSAPQKGLVLVRTQVSASSSPGSAVLVNTAAVIGPLQTGTGTVYKWSGSALAGTDKTVTVVNFRENTTPAGYYMAFPTDSTNATYWIDNQATFLPVETPR